MISKFLELALAAMLSQRELKVERVYVPRNEIDGLREVAKKSKAEVEAMQDDLKRCKATTGFSGISTELRASPTVAGGGVSASDAGSSVAAAISSVNPGLATVSSAIAGRLGTVPSSAQAVSEDLEPLKPQATVIPPAPPAEKEIVKITLFTSVSPFWTSPEPDPDDLKSLFKPPPAKPKPKSAASSATAEIVKKEDLFTCIVKTMGKRGETAELKDMYGETVQLMLYQI